MFKRFPSSIFFTDEVLWFTTGLSAVLWIVIGGLTVWAYREFTLTILIGFREGQTTFLGTRNDLAAIVTAALFMCLVNMVLVYVLYPRSRVLSRIISVSTAMLSGLILIAVSVIMAVN
jgi:hypothetical protein